MIHRALLCLGALLALAVAGAGGAQAQSFNFSYMSMGMSVMGIFNTTEIGTSGRYRITSITDGMRGGNAITLLSPGNFDGNDNVLSYPSQPYFDISGVAYTDGTTDYNVYNGGFGYAEYSPGSGNYSVSDVTITPAPAPLPGGGLLSFLALGLAGLIWRGKTIVAFGRALRTRPAAGR